MPDSVDSPAPLKIATLPMVKASTNIPNEFGLLSIATASTSSPDVMAIVCQKDVDHLRARADVAGSEAISNLIASFVRYRAEGGREEIGVMLVVCAPLSSVLRQASGFRCA